LLETRTILELFQPFQRHFIGHTTCYDLGSPGQTRVFLVQSAMGTSSPGGSLSTIWESIQTLEPEAVIMVGVAFGSRPRQQQLGDVLVSQQLLDYDLQRVNRGPQEQVVIVPRGSRPHASTRLLDRFRAGALDWPGARVHFGLILSGAKLVDHQYFHD